MRPGTRSPRVTNRPGRHAWWIHVRLKCSSCGLVQFFPYKWRHHPPSGDPPAQNTGECCEVYPGGGRECRCGQRIPPFLVWNPPDPGDTPRGTLRF